MIQQQNSRLLSLDVMRGITIAGMIMVNNAGSWKYIYAPLRHAAWDGLTPTDLVFPFFMFIMGISTFISLRKYNFQAGRPAWLKILKRTGVIFLIGLGLNWLSLSFSTYHRLAAEDIGIAERLIKSLTNFENLRILGVMQRLALTYGITALAAIFVKHKYIPYIIVVTLTGYLLLLLFGNGFELSEDNILSVFDRAVLGASHMYTDSGVKLDPEGLLSTLPAVCHVMIGFYCGKMLFSTKDNYERINRFFIVGVILTFAGLLLSYGCPINKKIWSPAFVLVTCGFASSFLALLIWIIDIRGHRRWSVFFESFGVNPLFIYVMAAVLSTLIEGTFITYRERMMSVKSFIYNVILQPAFGDYSGSLVYALLFVVLNWCIGNILYKKKIYIKI
ncbi:MAG TPA: DUF5009 domain-containing protein [Dysgonomonas sp.]|nr:DUF5009 domain-containing protein [Dysgonomonas sp.]